MYEDRSPVLRNQQTVVVGTGDTLLIGPNPRRVGLLIGTPNAHRVTLAFTGPAVDQQGIVLNPGTAPLALWHQFVADAITEEIRAVAYLAPEVITVVEFFR